jgi:hypothetical protein
LALAGLYIFVLGLFFLFGVRHCRQRRAVVDDTDHQWRSN